MIFFCFCLPHAPSPSKTNASIILYDIIQVIEFVNNILNFEIDRIIFFLMGKIQHVSKL